MTTVHQPTRSRRGLFGLLSAEAVSLLGTRMSMLAVPWFVLITTGSATRTGLAAFAELAPYVLMQAFGGPIVDKFGARTISIVTDVIAGVGLLAVPLLFAADKLSFTVLLGLLAATGLVRGAGDIARRVLLPGVQEAAQMPMERATGIYDGVNRAAGMIGAPLAGVLIAVFSAPLVIAIDALTFLAAAVIVFVNVPKSAEPEREIDEEQLAYLDQLREAWRFIRRDRLLMGIAVMVFVTNLFDMGMASVLMPVWVEDRIGSPVALGVIAALFGIAAVLGNVGAAWLGNRLPRRLTYAWGFLIGGSPRFFVLAIAVTLSPVLVVMVAAGLAVGVINPILGAVEYERVPRPLQARVLGAIGALAWAGLPLGGLVAGALVSTAGLEAALWIIGIAYFVTTLVPFVFPAWRGMDRAVLRT